MGGARAEERAALRLEELVARVERSPRGRNAGKVSYGGRKGRHGWLQTLTQTDPGTVFPLPNYLKI